MVFTNHWETKKKQRSQALSCTPVTPALRKWRQNQSRLHKKKKKACFKWLKLASGATIPTHKSFLSLYHTQTKTKTHSQGRATKSFLSRLPPSLQPVVSHFLWLACNYLSFFFVPSVPVPLWGSSQFSGLSLQLERASSSGCPISLSVSVALHLFPLS